MELNAKKSELIGEIRTTQRFLKHTVSPKEHLLQKTVEDFTELAQSLQAELAKWN